MVSKGSSVLLHSINNRHITSTIPPRKLRSTWIPDGYLYLRSSTWMTGEIYERTLLVSTGRKKNHRGFDTNTKINCKPRLKSLKTVSGVGTVFDILFQVPKNSRRTLFVNAAKNNRKLKFRIQKRPLFCQYTFWL